jgi:hypothetical protein
MLLKLSFSGMLLPLECREIGVDPESFARRDRLQRQRRGLHSCQLQNKSAEEYQGQKLAHTEHFGVP